MTEYMTEQEQIQQLKNWLKQYGFTIVAGIVLAIAVTSGWRYWQDHTNKQLMQASATYEEMLALRAQGNTNESIAKAKSILKTHANTSYAQMAAFLLAREATVSKDYSGAITQLNWVVENSSDKSMKEIARLRIARILIADKKPQEAVELLKTVDDKNFKSMIDEVKGDAYLAMNDRSSARKAYEQALEELPNAEVVRPILQLKLDNLAG